jgi:hypothetical protein
MRHHSLNPFLHLPAQLPHHGRVHASHSWARTRRRGNRRNARRGGLGRSHGCTRTPHPATLSTALRDDLFCSPRCLCDVAIPGVVCLQSRMSVRTLCVCRHYDAEPKTTKIISHKNIRPRDPCLQQCCSARTGGGKKRGKKAMFTITLQSAKVGGGTYTSTHTHWRRRVCVKKNNIYKHVAECKSWWRYIHFHTHTFEATSVREEEQRLQTRCRVQKLVEVHTRSGSTSRCTVSLQRDQQSEARVS